MQSILWVLFPMYVTNLLKSWKDAKGPSSMNQTDIGGVLKVTSGKLLSHSGEHMGFSVCIDTILTYQYPEL